MKKRLPFLMVCFLLMSISHVNAQLVVTASRAANSVDVIWTFDPAAASYKILGFDDLLYFTIPQDPGLSDGAVYSKTVRGLENDTEYSFTVKSFSASGEELASGMVTVTTRRAGVNYEIIDDFDHFNGAVWELSNNSGTVDYPVDNDIKGGINASDMCGKYIKGKEAWARNYSGPALNTERLEVGPNAPYRYLHVKMYRVVTGTPLATPELGGFSIQCNTRADSAQITAVNKKIAYNAQFVDGAWHDYTFDLRALSSTDKAFFSWYFKANEFGGGSYTMQTDYYMCIDDIYLSNSGSPLNAAIEPVDVVLTAGTNGKVPVSGSYLVGSVVTATPDEGFEIDQWSDGTHVLSTTADCVITGKGTLTATFKLATGLTNITDNNLVKVEGRTICFLKEVESVDIYNTVGTVVYSQKQVSAHSSIPLDRSGIYLLKVQTNQGMKVQKIAIK